MTRAGGTGRLLPAAALSLLSLHTASARIMAVLPAGAVPGVTEALTVAEDLAIPGAPIIFSSASGAELYRVTKNEAVPQTNNASWGASLSPPVGLDRVLGEEADLLGNAMLAEKAADGRDGYERIAGLAPPVLANAQSADDYELTQGTFIGSRVSAQKHSFDHTGRMNNLDIRQKYHLDITQIDINNTYIGLLGGFTPGTRWFWPQGQHGYSLGPRMKMNEYLGVGKQITRLNRRETAESEQGCTFAIHTVCMQCERGVQCIPFLFF